MRRYYNLIFWVASVLLLSGVLRSITKDYYSSLLLAIALLPGVIAAKLLIKEISKNDRRTAMLHSIYLAIITLLIEYLSIIFVQNYLFNFGLNKESEILFNPFFLWLIMICLLSLEKLIEIKYLSVERVKENRVIEFTSERKKISIPVDSIIFIESRDYEVWVRCADGLSYRTKMNISHWEEVLDSRFIRVHRSYLVNKTHITKTDSSCVYAGGKTIEISRKYKERIQL
ncbi:MAG: hypothetical protein A2266_07210 [Bacteroidetes bacterium RIFOXYA12_FULL_40_10]|nr:MAG: hypothetical protein A2266_07210 [Bacteroidetes bacterium RIFOXYA12_FULL_40_10]